MMTASQKALRESRDASIRELIRISRVVGNDPRLIQGGGGNTSVKSADRALMWVKASGTALGEMAPDLGYRAVRVAEAVGMLHDRDLAALTSGRREPEVLARLLAACTDDLSGRPSVETGLHALLDRYVIHVHPAAANGLACARDGEAAVARIFGTGRRPPLFLRYTDPGFMLARSTYRRVQRYRRTYGALPEIIFLANHGVFVSTAAADRALALTRALDRTVRAKWAAAVDSDKETVPRWTAVPPEGRRRVAASVSAALRKAARPYLGDRLTVTRNEEPDVRRFLRDRDAGRLCRVGPLTPDHMVYARGAPIWIAEANRFDLTEFIAGKMAANEERLGAVPRCALVKGVGLFTVDRSRKQCASAEGITRASLMTLLVAKGFGGPRALTPRAARFINQWEVEEFRRRAVR